MLKNDQEQIERGKQEKKVWQTPEIKEVLSVHKGTQGLGTQISPTKETIFYNQS